MPPNFDENEFLRLGIKYNLPFYKQTCGPTKTPNSPTSDYL